MSDLAGRTLGQYEIIALIGQGGMAKVYRAKQSSMDREVAVKVIIGELAESQDFMARFEREARLIAHLQHPHILPVFDFGRTDGLVYLVMRLVEGGSLDSKLREGPMPLPQAARVFKQIASALSYAHDMGVIHRDLKPNNILLDTNGNPYLTDFGIAKMLQERTTLTATGAIIGTPSYMAPEQWRSEPIDARTDIYALGIMLYEMLTGDLPFKGDTPFALMYKHFDTLPRPPNELRPELPETVGYVMSRAMAKSPEDRYVSAILMAEDLDAALMGKPINIGDPPSTLTLGSGEIAYDIKSQQTFIGDNNLSRVAKSESRGSVTESADQLARRTGRMAESAPATSVPSLTSAGVQQPGPAAGHLPMNAVLGIVALLLLVLIGGGFFLASQSTANSNATATQLAVLGGTQTMAAQLAATTTALALLPTTTPTAATTALPTAVRFTDFNDQALNIKFRQPTGWEVEKRSGVILYIAAHTKDLTFRSDGIVTGPPFFQVIVGNSETFGSLDMANAKTPMDAMTAFLGGERITNLDPVFGTHFPTATTTRIRADLGAIRVLYLMILGPDQFALVQLHAPPDQSAQLNSNMALPLVRSFDFAMTPTVASAVTPSVTPTPSAIFEMPSAFSPYINDPALRFNYPDGWAFANTGSDLVMAPPLAKVNGEDVNSPPYIVIGKRKQQDISYKAEYSILDLFRDNLGMSALNPQQVDGAPYSTAVGRSLGNGKLKVNGWLALVKLDEENFLVIYAQAPRGAEMDYFQKVLIPVLKSLKVQRAQ